MRHAFFAAACSHAAGEDLPSTFTCTYPIDEPNYAQVCAALSGLPPAAFADGLESGNHLAWAGVLR